MVKSFRAISLLEGISFLSLLFFAMPMKYIYESSVYVKNIGMIHGLLFILYLFYAVYLKFEKKWHLKKFITILLASVLPFGTFYIDRKFLQNEQ